MEDVKEKVRVATILGTLQSRLTQFGPALSPEWKDNCDKEALLGVSLTGIMDNELMSGTVQSHTHRESLHKLDEKIKQADKHFLEMFQNERRTLIKTIACLNHQERNSDEFKARLQVLREVARETNKIVAKSIGVKQSAAITCVKPSGTVSQLVDSASGIHPRHAHYYTRRVRLDAKDPMVQFLSKEAPWLHIEDDCYNTSQKVVSFPKMAPPESILRCEWTAIEQLDLWLLYNEHYCEHKPSITVYVGDVNPDNNPSPSDSPDVLEQKKAARAVADLEDWKQVGEWVWEHFDAISGLAFLPRDNGSYSQAPYDPITEAEYREAIGKTQSIPWSNLSKYEIEDTRLAGISQMACTGDKCDL